MISFDLFDTLLTRKTYSPRGIFLLVQQRVFDELKDISQYISYNFCTLRVNAEKDARLYAEQEGREEITLDEIYDLLAYRSSMPKEIAKQIKEWEIQAEIDNTYSLIHNMALLNEFLAKGESVVLISDMYLSEEVIRKILLKNSPSLCHIPIYVSSEIGKTKRSGSLYFEVAKREKATFSDWIHFGDNKNSDYLMPKMLGIDARHIPFEGLTSWESKLGQQLELKNNLALQFYFGVARNIRLEKKLNSVGRIGGSIGGILLYPYVSWLLRKSKEMGIRYLYFIARDGYILKKIADLIIRHQGLDICTSYIYGSRKAWRINELSEEDKAKVIMYLSQEIDFSESDFAFVDLNGTGITMESLSQVIYQEFGRKTIVFYFDLMRNRISENYIFIPFCSIYSSTIELFCRAPHGATIGYDKNGTNIIPRLQKADKPYWEKAGLADYVEGVEFFGEKMSQCQWGYWMEDIGLAEAVLLYCQNEPCQELCDFMGNIPHYDGIEEENIQYAPVLSRGDIFHIYMWRTMEDISKYYSGVNLKLSLMRTNHKYDKEKKFFERHYNSALGRCIHRLKNKGKRSREGSKKIVIYGAGTIGKRLYGHLITISGFDIIGWTDMNYERYQHDLCPVIPLLDVLNLEFDYIVIAIGDAQSSRYVYKNLLELGVEEARITGYKEFLDKEIK